MESIEPMLQGISAFGTIVSNEYRLNNALRASADVITGGDGEMPIASREASILEPGEAGNWIELDEFGVPLGEWIWDDTEEVWIFEFS